MKEFAVLHIDAERSWRGGQQQALYLHQGMHEQGHKTGFICRPDSQLQLRLKENKVPFQTIKYRHNLDFWAGYKLALFAGKQGYNILHLHSSHALNWGHIAKLFAPSLRLVASRRVTNPINKNPISRWKYCGENTNKVVAISESIRRVMLKDGVPEQKIELIYDGIDIRRLNNCMVDKDYRMKWKIAEDALIIGTVAAFSDSKDYNNFIRAAALALKHNPRLHFVAIGDGALFSEMQKLAYELGIAAQISFTGFQKNIGKHMKAFDIYVIASKSEGLGTAALDAMSLGLPVIGTRAGGIPEVIQDKINGLLVAAQNSEDLAQAMLTLAADAELREDFGVAALERVKFFSKEKMVAAHLRLYESLL